MISYKFDVVYEEEFKTLSVYHATQEDIDQLVFPKDLEEIVVIGDYIQRFTIPKGVERATIGMCALREIHVPDSVRYLNVEENCLTRLELPENIEHVRAVNNYLEKIEFRKPPRALQVFLVHKNRLQELTFEAPTTLDYVDVRKNPLMNVSDSIKRIIYSTAPDSYERLY